MNRLFRNRKVLISALFGAESLENDIGFKEYQEARGLDIENDWKRMKNIFLRDEDGNMHPDLLHAVQIGTVTLLGGGIYGSVVESRIRLDAFFRLNDTNIYANVKEAHKVLVTEHLLAMGKGFIKWGPKVALFCGTFSLVASCYEIYNKKGSVVEYIIGGGTVGALFKFSYGIKGLISGGIVGGILGSIYGFTVYGLTKLTGTDPMQVKFNLYLFSKYFEPKIDIKLLPPEENASESESPPRHLSKPLENK